MKKLATLGDAFLKLGTCLSLYHQHPGADTGKLTLERDAQVCNNKLHQLAREKRLRRYIDAQKTIYFGAEANWLPPGYRVDGVNANRYTTFILDRKIAADLVESLVGCYLLSTDCITTIQFMRRLGFDVIPVNKQGRHTILFTLS